MHAGVLASAAALALGLTAFAQQAATPPKPPQSGGEFQMAQYFLVLLKKGPQWTGTPTVETAKIQEGHMANIRKMAATGKLVVAGPTEGKDDDLRGIFIFLAADEDEVRKLMAPDPAVAAGRLQPEVHRWWAGKGLTAPGK
jgi:uncharacterized protein